MRKIVITYGLITGLIITTFMAVTAAMCTNNSDFEPSMALGFGVMLAAFSFIFIGIKKFRDNENSGIITFGKAFKTGLYITLIASVMYTVVWLIEYYFFIPDFMEKYAAHVIKQTRAEGASQVEIEKKIAEMAAQQVMYKNPLWVVLLTFAEIFPLGILVALISALILKRKNRLVIN